MTNPKLSSLLQSAPEADPEVPLPRAPDWRARLATLLPLALGLGFLVLLALVLGDRLIPARKLAFESVVTLKTDPGAQTGTSPAGNPYEAPMLFQASGWIEPDPLPVKATALVDGVVASVQVLEGEEVTEGQLLATLIDEDAELDLRTAQTRLASLKALDASHHAAIAFHEAEITTLQKQVAVAEAKRDELADQAKRFENLPPGSVPDRDVSQARLRLRTQEAEIIALSASGAELEQKFSQHREMANDFKARIAEAETEVARRQLALTRTRIHSPIDGVVLRLLAVPGQKRMLGMDDPDSATIAILYQPDKLQARIDVPLEEAAQLAVGQHVRLRSNLLPNHTFRGQVTRIVGEADLQRNTLQAKVRIENPDPRLRPDMLCRAEFLAATSTDLSPSGGSQAGRIQVYVSEAALRKRSSDSAIVWLLDESGRRLDTQSIKLGREEREGHLLVLEGLKPGDRVVLNPPNDLKPGQRAKPLP